MKGLHKPDFVGAFAICRRDERILFVANERSFSGRTQRTWDLPGGHVESRELLHEALRRELCEEARLEVVGVPELAFVQEGERVQAGERLYAWRSFFFLTDTVGEPVADHEVLDVRWMTPDEVQRECRAPYHDSFCQWLREGGGYFLSEWGD